MSEEKVPGAVPARAMVVMAHPDDAEFSCAATVATRADWLAASTTRIKGH